MYLYCIIFFYAYKSRLRRKRFFKHVHVCVLAFSPTRPIAENVHCTVYGDIYVEYYMSCAERTKNNPNCDLSSSRYIVCCRPSIRDGGLTGGRVGSFWWPVQCTHYLQCWSYIIQYYGCCGRFSSVWYYSLSKRSFGLRVSFSSALIKRQTEFSNVAAADVFIITSNKSYPVALRPFFGSISVYR